MDFAGWETNSHQISPRGQSGLLDVIGLDPEWYYQQNSTAMLQIYLEGESGSHVCLGQLGQNHTSKEMRGMGYEESKLLYQCSGCKIGMECPIIQ